MMLLFDQGVMVCMMFSLRAPLCCLLSSLSRLRIMNSLNLMRARKWALNPMGMSCCWKACLSQSGLTVQNPHGDRQDAVTASLRGRAPNRQQPLFHNARPTIPQRRLFRREATVTAQKSVTFLTLIIRGVIVPVDLEWREAALASPRR